MKLLLENWREYLNESLDLSFLPPEILNGEEEYDEDEGEEGILVKNIPMKTLSMLQTQGERILEDVWKGEISQTEGMPALFYNLEEQQLIVDDGNHRIFQEWLKGKDHFDAYIYSGTHSNYLRHVYDGDEEFDWSEEYR